MSDYRLGKLLFRVKGEFLGLLGIGDYVCRGEASWKDGLFLAAFDKRRVEGRQWLCKRVLESENALEFQMEDMGGALTLRSVWRYCPASGIISRRDTLKNRLPSSIFIRRFLARFPFASGEYEIYTQQNRWGLENQGQWSRFNAGMLRLLTRWGRSTEGGTPFAAVRADYHSHGVAFHLLPEGNWTMRFYKEVFSNLKPYMIAEMGQSDEDLYAEVKPGKEMSTPEILIQSLPGREIESGTEDLHRYALQHLVLEAKVFPVIYNTWLDKMESLSVPRLRRQLAAAKAVGCETFVIDAGWFRILGDWREKDDAAFEGRMKDFADEVRAAGLQFGIWFEPEFLAPSIPMLQVHPEWFTETAPGDVWRIRTETVEGRDYLYQFISEAIRKYGLRYLKLDMNHTCGYDRTGDELSSYALGWREAISRLHRDFPEVIFENCSSGAMRTDLNTLRFFDTHFISDNANPWEVVRITQGMLLRFPPGRILRWMVAAGTENFRPEAMNDDELIAVPQAATWYNFEKADLNYAMLASMMGVLGFSGDLAGMRPETLKKIAGYVSFYKEHREAIFRSEASLLTPPEPVNLHEGWAVFQLTDPVGGEVHIFAFHKNSDGNPVCRVHMRNLRKNGRYRLPDGMVMSGEQLEREGLPIEFEYYQHGEYKARVISLTLLS